VDGVADAVEVIVGDTSTCVRTRSGVVKCWGENSYGQLGDGTTASRTGAAEVKFCASSPEPVFPAPPPGVRLVAALQRDTCKGSCPRYSVRVYEDGTVIYRGDWYVRVRGGRKAKISERSLEQLMVRFREIDFLGLRLNCTMHHTDARTARIFFADGSRYRLIDDYHGCEPTPKALRDLEVEMDRIVDTERWVGQRRDRSSVGHEPVDLQAMEPNFQEDALRRDARR
jgi:hypothetical protein